MSSRNFAVLLIYVICSVDAAQRLGLSLNNRMLSNGCILFQPDVLIHFEISIFYFEICIFVTLCMILSQLITCSQFSVTSLQPLQLSFINPSFPSNILPYPPFQILPALISFHLYTFLNIFVDVAIGEFFYSRPIFLCILVFSNFPQLLQIWTPFRLLDFSPIIFC